MNAARRLLSLLAAAVVTAAGAAPAPRLVCDAPVFRFGERFSDEPDLRHTFTLRNEGNLSLEIREIQNQCGCTDLVLSSKTIRPGDSAELSVAFATRGRSGAVRQSLTVVSNDPRTPRLELAFEGAVRPYVELLPMGALLGRVPPDRETTLEIEIRFPEERPDAVLAAESNAAFLRADVKEVVPRREYIVAIRTVPPLSAPHGHLRGAVTVKTASGRKPETVIPVAGWIMAPVIVAPDALPLPAESAEPLSRYIAVRAGSARKLRIEGVDLPDPRIRVTTQPIEGEGFHIRLDGIRPAELPADAAAVVRVRHADGRAEYRVPFIRESDAPPPPPPARRPVRW